MVRETCFVKPEQGDLVCSLQERYGSLITSNPLANLGQAGKVRRYSILGGRRALPLRSSPLGYQQLMREGASIPLIEVALRMNCDLGKYLCKILQTRGNYFNPFYTFKLC